MRTKLGLVLGLGLASLGMGRSLPPHLPSDITVRVDKRDVVATEEAVAFWHGVTGANFHLVNGGKSDIRVIGGIRLNPSQEGVAYLPGSKWDGEVRVSAGASAWVVAHEIGHVLGYAHVQDTRHLMSPVENGEWVVESSEGVAASYRRSKGMEAK